MAPFIMHKHAFLRIHNIYIIYSVPLKLYTFCCFMPAVKWMLYFPHFCN